MKSVAFRLIAFGAAGVAINVLVAWARAYWAMPVYVDAAPIAAEDAWPSQGIPVWARSRTFVSIRWAAIGLNEDIVSWWPDPNVPHTSPSAIAAGLAKDLNEIMKENVPNRDPAVQASGFRQLLTLPLESRQLPVRIDAGWPLRSLRGWTIEQDGARPADISVFSSDRTTFDAIALPRAAGSNSLNRAMPCRPIAFGFAVNTSFYAAAAWLLAFIPRTIRSRLRLRRGLCPGCGYPIGASPVCTECGRPVVSVRR